MLSTTSGLASNMTPYLFLAESDGVSVPNFDKYICARGQKHHFTVIACVSHTLTFQLCKYRGCKSW